ncbi:RodZ domain-containing protein [Anaerobacillus sp. MEB173]|uniref:helix-turn-helix domain-containing protein n=1 Tax=Anaerobacillus sp. MEB173 TaxID=3383345 RepID=UPI003F939855
MSEIGLRLKQAREQKNISLDELQGITKIQKRYLAAIEEGRFNSLPGQFYARAFVKNYAEAVGLDPEVLFEEHGNELPNLRTEATETPPRMQRKKTKVEPTKSRIVTLLPALLTSLFIIGIAFGVWYFYQDDEAVEGIPNTGNEQTEAEFNDDLPEGEAPEETNDTVTEEVQAPVEEEPKEVVEEKQQVLTVTDTKGKKTFYELSETDEFKVEIEFTGNSYVGIANGKGNPFKEAMVYEGETLVYDFSGEETIYFNIGATNNVNMKINEQPFKFPQEIVHQQLEITFKKNISQ